MLNQHPNSSSQVIIDNVVKQLQETYPNNILKEPKWMFNNAGGAMGSMLVLHCSLSEYVIIFGTAVGTEGHTGRFLADDYFTILYGEQVIRMRIAKCIHMPVGNVRRWLSLLPEFSEIVRD